MKTYGGVDAEIHEKLYLVQPMKAEQKNAHFCCIYYHNLYLITDMQALLQKKKTETRLIYFPTKVIQLSLLCIQYSSGLDITSAELGTMTVCSEHGNEFSSGCNETGWSGVSFTVSANINFIRCPNMTQVVMKLLC
jgi:hypothetical protein